MSAGSRSPGFSLISQAAPCQLPLLVSAQSSGFFPGTHQAMVPEPLSSQSTVTPLMAVLSLMAENVISTLKRSKCTSPACQAPSNLGSYPTLCSMSPRGFLESFSNRIPDLSKFYCHCHPHLEVNGSSILLMEANKTLESHLNLLFGT